MSAHVCEKAGVFRVQRKTWVCSVLETGSLSGLQLTNLAGAGHQVLGIAPPQHGALQVHTALPGILMWVLVLRLP